MKILSLLYFKSINIDVHKNLQFSIPLSLQIPLQRYNVVHILHYIKLSSYDKYNNIWPKTGLLD